MLRKINKNDRELFLNLCDEFYHTDAVTEPIPSTLIENTFNELIQSDAYVECYIIETENQAVGYGLLSKSFSPEVGGKIVWFEELYIRELYQGKGLGKEFFSYVFKNIPASRYRLEIDKDNTRACQLYKKLGFDFLPYLQLIKDKN